MSRPIDPAFPVPDVYDERTVGYSPGLTKIELVSAIILAGILSNPETNGPTAAEAAVYHAHRLFNGLAKS